MRAPEEEEDWEQLLGDVLGRAGNTGWETGLLSSAGAMDVSKHSFVRGQGRRLLGSITRREAGMWWLIWG